MPLCAYAGCEVSSPKRIQDDGYCAKHSDAQKNVLQDLLNRVKALEDDNISLKADNNQLKADNVSLKNSLNYSLQELHSLGKHINSLQSSVNTSNYERDEIEQYGRYESWRGVDITELPIKYDQHGEIVDDEDCSALAIEIAATVGVTLEKKDIQRAHRVGRRRVP